MSKRTGLGKLSHVLSASSGMQGNSLKKVCVKNVLKCNLTPVSTKGPSMFLTGQRRTRGEGQSLRQLETFNHMQKLVVI